MKRMLVLCTGNSCRSQMAEAYLRLFADKSAEIFSAGIEAHGINALAIRVMKEDGIDISEHTSNLVDDYKDVKFDFELTVCDNAAESCPYISSKAIRIHRNFADPAKASGSDVEKLEAFRLVRDQIKTFCSEFVAQYL